MNVTRQVVGPNTSTVLSRIKNGGRNIEPAHKFMVMTSLLVIKLKATAIGNQTIDFYSRGRNLALSMMCNVTPTLERFIFHRPNILTGKFKHAGYVGV